MDPFTLINILMHGVSAVPSIQAEIKSALSANWNKGIVQDFAQGVSILSTIVNDVGASFEPASGGIESPILAPATPTPTTEQIEAAKAVIAAAPAPV